MAECIDRGLDEVRDEQETIRDYVEDLEEIDATLDPKRGSCARRKKKFETLASRFQGKKDPIHKHFAKIMLSFLAGLFVGGAKFAKIRDNLDLERWFRLPKSHGAGSTAIVTRAFGLFRRGPQPCTPWMHTPHTPSRSLSMICCRIVRLDRQRARLRR